MESEALTAHVSACSSCLNRPEFRFHGTQTRYTRVSPAILTPAVIVVLAYPRDYPLSRARKLERTLHARGLKLGRLSHPAGKSASGIVRIARRPLRPAGSHTREKGPATVQERIGKEVREIATIIRETANECARDLGAVLFIARQPLPPRELVPCPSLFLRAALASLHPGDISLGAELYPHLHLAARARPILNLDDVHGMLTFRIAHSADRKRMTHPERYPHVLGTIHQKIAADQYEAAGRDLRALIDSIPNGSGLRLEAHRLLARSMRRLERTSEAYTLIRQALASASKGPPALIGDLYNELAYCHYSLGRLEAAEEAQERAVEKHRLADDARGLARDYLLTAHIHLNRDRMNQAHNTYLRVLSIASTLGDIRLLSNALQGLGQVELEIGKLSNARLSLSQAAELFHAGSDLRGGIRILGELGRLEAASQRWGEAEACCTDQLRLMEKRNLSAPSYEGTTRTRKGRILMATRRYKEARAEFERTLRLQALAPRHRFAPRLALAQLCMLEGDYTQAWRHYRKAARDVSILPISDRWKLRLLHASLLEAEHAKRACSSYLKGIREVERVREGLPARMRQPFFATMNQLFDGWIRCLIRKGASPTLILRATERARFQGFFESLSRHEPAPRIESSPSNAESWSRRSSPPKAIRPRIDSLPKEVVICSVFTLSTHLLLFRISRGRVEMRELDLRPDTLRDLCSSAVDELTGEVVPSSEPVHSPMVPDSSGHPPGISALLHASRVLLAPIWDWIRDLDDHHALGFINHGALNGFPWHCLPLPHSDRLLIDHCPVFYIPSLQSLELIERPREEPRDARILCMANPSGDLPFSEHEASQAFKGIALKRDQLYGPKATLSAFRAHSARAKYMHLALHARGGGPGRPAELIFRRGDPRHSAESSMRGRDCFDEEQASIHAAELAEMTMPAEFVVISACQAGREDASGSREGINLLPWAFMMAGARSVIASITNLDDYHSATLMRSFYAHLAAGRGRALALALAQREHQALLDDHQEATQARFIDETTSSSRRKGAARSFWAGLFLTGDWRPLPEYTPSPENRFTLEEKRRDKR